MGRKVGEPPKPKELNPAQSTYIMGSYTSMDIIENSKYSSTRRKSNYAY
jgi:hypothetical protein